MPVTKEGNIGNIFEINLTNKTNEEFDVVLKTDDKDAKIDMVVQKLHLDEQGHIKERFVIRMPMHRLENGKMD